VPEIAADRIRLGPADVGSALNDAIPNRRFIVVSNREPYEHSWDDGQTELEVRRPAGGLVAALDPLMQAVGGTWIAWGSGEADAEVVDERQRVRVPPEAPAYTLRRLWLNQQDVQHYYHGYSNQFLWPLCHLRPKLTRIRGRYWQRYEAVNRRFAEAVLDEVGDDAAAVWFQDYHLALAPGYVRAANNDIALAHFWHIPFPPLELFRIATNGAELLEGLLANDLLGFHLPLFCDNFLRCVESVLDVPVDWDRRAVVRSRHTCFVRAMPISIDVDAYRAAASPPGVEARLARIRARYAPQGGQLGIGVDRIDYSKGLEEKFTALDMLWDRYPELRETFTYMQVGVPSRTGIEAYDWLREKLGRMVWSINDRYGTAAWRPVHLIEESLPMERLAPLYRAADLCVVSSLQDGMNLVAKEFVACQVDDPGGVLLLSRFAGAVEELSGCIEVNPYDPETFAEAIRDALALSDDERRERLQRLDASLRNIYDWMAETFVGWGAVIRDGEAPLTAADRWNRFR
jgi:trehalose 6-phosphate synthase/phosphatase